MDIQSMTAGFRIILSVGQINNFFGNLKMSEQLHIIIASDRGKIHKLPCSKKKLQYIFAFSVVSLLFLVVTSVFSISLFTKNQNNSNEIVKLREQLRTSAELIAEHQRLSEEQKLRLDLQLSNLELTNVKQEVAFKKEKETLISTAISELTERSELIENIMGSIGIELPKDEVTDTKNSGGPFIRQPDKEWDELLYKADKYLKAIRYLPFGRPVTGPITSRFGKRRDPVNKKKGFHTGIDFRGKRGEKIYATADGVVKKAFRNGGYGNYVLINHNNGYSTIYAHMQAYLVHKGDTIKRGQIVGLVGNTGRSTGPHLHYEICLDKKPINPYNFMKVAKSSQSTQKKAQKE